MGTSAPSPGSKKFSLNRARFKKQCACLVVAIARTSLRCDVLHICPQCINGLQHLRTALAGSIICFANRTRHPSDPHHCSCPNTSVNSAHMQSNFPCYEILLMNLIPNTRTLHNMELSIHPHTSTLYTPNKSHKDCYDLLTILMM